MQIFKRVLGILLSAVLVITLLCPALQPVSAADFILKPSELNGSDYTDSDRLAAALNEVFAGNIGIYSDSSYKNEVSMPVGYSMSTKTQYYTKSQTTGNPISGWQCYIYANAAYNKLFREWVGHADEGFAHSRIVVPGGSSSMSYELLKNAGVRCGAYLRTTKNSDGSYDGNNGHSMLILAYDKTNITFLEGNANGNGLVRVTVRTWSDFNAQIFAKKTRYISHIVQPTEAFYKAQYPACTHETYEGNGVCSGCGYVYDWRRTLDPWAQGIYRLTEKVVPRADAPYSTASAANIVLEKDHKIRTTGQYRNAFDQVWYSAVDDAGKTFYVNAASLKFVEYPPLEATCTGFLPEDGAQLSQNSYPVRGMVTSNFPLKSVSGYLDGERYASWKATDETTNKLDLRGTDLNSKLSFSKLEGGKHTVRLEAESFVHGQPVTIHESTFYIVSPEPCNHEYTKTVTLDATCVEDGILTYTCIKCEDSYTRTIAAHGHNYQNNICIDCGDKLMQAGLKGSILSAGNPADPVTVTLLQGGTEYHKVSTTDGAYAITGIRPGEYEVIFSKNGCVTRTEKVTLEQGDLTLDTKLCVPGDVTGDQRLNLGDMSQLYAHVRGQNLLQSDYALLCADYTGDGNINIGDTVRLYAYLCQNG